VLPYVKDTDTILLANHGTVTYGSDLEDAYFKTEIIDAYCRILIVAKQIGRVNFYTDEKAAELIRLKPKLGIPDPRLERGLENCDLCGNSLFREGYGEPGYEPRVFVHPKLAGGQTEPSPIDSRLTPLAADARRTLAGGAADSRPTALAQPSANGPGHAGPIDQEALVQAITDQVMQALNGIGR
jgi:L-fuculose-phosphate aldolase